MALSEKEWDRVDNLYGADGKPFISFDEHGKMTIHDPLLAQWDAEARADQGVDSGRG